jgi:hypothetical protein
MALPVVKEEPLMEAEDAFGPEKLAAIQQLNVDPVRLTMPDAHAVCCFVDAHAVAVIQATAAFMA